MAKCKDCVHYDACKDAYDGNWDDFDECDLYCEHFKNKADFVEVVRCKECRFYVPPFCYRPKNRPHHTHGILPSYFCSYGERK